MSEPEAFINGRAVTGSFRLELRRGDEPVRSAVTIPRDLKFEARATFENPDLYDLVSDGAGHYASVTVEQAYWADPLARPVHTLRAWWRQVRDIFKYEYRRAAGHPPNARMTVHFPRVEWTP